MRTHSSLYLSLLGTYLLAAGCSASVENFADDRSYLECEIQVACGQMLDCETYDTVYVDSDCTKLNRRRANECLDKLDEHLVNVESNPAACDESYYYEACEQAVKQRKTCPSQSQVIDGRPLLHDGHAVLPEIIKGHAWSEQALGLDSLEATSAVSAAATHWLNAARTEHASIAAFSRVCLELMSVGAPPHLLEGCHRAAADEIRHARLALDVARALGDTSWDLGALPDVPSRTPTLREIAIDALLEGCIGEGTAAARAHITADRARGPIAHVLRTIAEDETRHASLAWSTVRWALLRDPSLADDLRQALSLARADRRGVPRAETDPALAKLGVMSMAEAARVECDVLEKIVEPVLGQLVRETEIAARLS